MVPIPPPSEPDGRVSRIRLSSRWFTAKRIGRSEPGRRGETVSDPARVANAVLHPVGVANMSSKLIFGGKPVSLASRVPAGLARRHSRRCRLRRSLNSPSTFLRSLRSRPVTAFHRYYGRSDSCPPNSGALKLNACSTCGQVSLIHALGLPTIPPPTTCGCSASPGHVTPRRVEPRPHPNSGNSGLRLSLVGSPHLAGRIEFVILRTSRSPPAALHPVLRRRSCSRLQVTLTWRGLSPLRPSALSGAPVRKLASALLKADLAPAAAAKPTLRHYWSKMFSISRAPWMTLSTSIPPTKGR